MQSIDENTLTTAVILAAGKGSRLHPITLNRSKAMLPILGRPIVERVMDDIAVNGVRDFILVVNPDDQQIIRYFQEESGLEADVRFVYQSERRGMADALRCAAPLIRSDFILSACDNLISANYIGRMLSRWKQEPRPKGLLTLLPVEPGRFGSVGMVSLEGEWITRIVEKPQSLQGLSNLSSLPIYAFTKKILNYLPEVPLSSRGEYELQDAIQMLIDRDGRVCGLNAEGRLTLTNAADLLAINRRFLKRGVNQSYIEPGNAGVDTRIIPPVYIESGTVIGKRCVIGPNVYIEKNCIIGDQVTITNAVILRETNIDPGSRIENRIL